MKKQIIIDYIKTEFGAKEERLWASDPDCVVFRNAGNKKWFAIIMDVDRSKLEKSGEGRVNVINVKSDPLLIGSLILKKGYYPAYHMNKQHWITILLDGSVDTSEIEDLIDMSYKTVDKRGKKRMGERNI